jgi:hypothetical protein
VKRPFEASWTTTAQGRPSFEVFAADPSFVAYVLARLVDERGAAIELAPVIGLDEVIAEVRAHGEPVRVGWDNWSGFYLFSDTESGDAVVRELGAWLEPQLPALEARFAQRG